MYVSQWLCHDVEDIHPKLHNSFKKYIKPYCAAYSML